MSNNVTSLAQFRAKKGLPPAVFEQLPMLERILVRYRAFDLFAASRVLPRHALRQVAISCAKQVVRHIEVADIFVADDARFQFFGVGAPGQESLQVRVNRVGPARGRKIPLFFEMEPASLEPKALVLIGEGSQEMKPLLTLPMTDFYRLR